MSKFKSTLWHVLSIIAGFTFMTAAAVAINAGFELLAIVIPPWLEIIGLAIILVVPAWIIGNGLMNSRLNIFYRWFKNSNKQ